MANGNGRDRIALGVTDYERATLGRHGALSAVYSSHINRTGPMLATFTASQALQALQAHGHSAFQQKAPRGSCPTLCYRVDGKAINLGLLRKMAQELPA